MNWNLPIWLLAQRSRWERLGDGFRGQRTRLDTNEAYVSLAIMGVLLIGLVGLGVYALRRDENRPTNSPWKLFGELCRAHQLTWRERSLLKRMARVHQLQQPAEVFLEPRYFDASSLPASLERHRHQILDLFRKLMDASQLEEVFDNRQRRPAPRNVAPDETDLPPNGPTSPAVVAPVTSASDIAASTPTA